jgi:hypothetical protein
LKPLKFKVLKFNPLALAAPGGIMLFLFRRKNNPV